MRGKKDGFGDNTPFNYLELRIPAHCHKVWQPVLAYLLATRASPPPLVAPPRRLQVEVRAAAQAATGYTALNIDMRGGSRSRAALRLVRPPLQRRTQNRTPGCAHLERRRHSAARSTCAAAPNVRSSVLATRRANTVCKSCPGTALPTRSSHKRADGLDAAGHLLCEGAVCTRVCDRLSLATATWPDTSSKDKTPRHAYLKGPTS